MDVDVELDPTELAMSNEIALVLDEIVTQLEENFHESQAELQSTVFTSPTPNRPINSELFSFVVTCDACGVQDSLFWRRVARTKTVCNNCFFSQTYLLMFKETKTKKNIDDLNPPVKYQKKTRSSLKKSIQKFDSINSHLTSLSESDIRNSIPHVASSSSSTTETSESAVNNEIIQDKMETSLEDLACMATITRKSARFINSNKTKKTENTGKTSSGKNNKKIKKLYKL